MPEPVTFTVDDKTYTLPVFTLTSGEMRKLRKLNNVDAWYTLLEMKADQATIAASDDLTYAEAANLMQRWMQGLSLGESSGSSS
jgi:hypothetical protein